MRGKGTRSSSSSAAAASVTSASTAPSVTHQITSGATQPTTPRTPGTPSDAGALTPNPPTPGNNNSNSMVGSSPQYVAITVEADATSGNDSGLSGGNSYVSYVEGSTEHSALYTATNGENISYPMYAVSESGTVYGSTSTTHFFAGTSSNGVTYAQDGGMFLVQSPSASNGNNNNNNNITIDGGGTANITNRVSPATKRKKTVPELCPLPSSSQRPRRQMSLKREYFEEDSDMLDEYEDVETYPSTANCSAMMSDMDPMGFDNSMNESVLQEGLDSDIEQLMFAGVSTSSIRTSPLTVQWLLDNYETAEGVSLPRSTLYNHYLHHCAEHKLDPVNAASFGKLIRSVFLGLRTRRLGTRGNSKYHYYGIRVKPDSPLIHVKDDDFFLNGHYASNGHHHGSRASSGGNHLGGSGPAKRFKPSTRNDLADGVINGFVVGDTSSFMEFLGDPSGALDDFPELETGEESYPEGIVENDLFVFRTLYREHYKALMEALANFQLPQFEVTWKAFWRGGDGVPETPNSVNYETILPKAKMIMICKMNVVQEFVKQVDYAFYQHVAEMLLPDVLRPIPSAMTQAIRNFAKVVESWLSSSLIGYPEDIVSLKISAVNALAQTLRRYTSLNHLAQAARAVLQNQNQIAQMLSDLNRVDFRNVEEQASWVCGCGGEIVPNVEQDFKNTLSQQQTLDQWGAWLVKVVDKLLKPHEDKPNFVRIARHFLLKWSFYSSLVIRDLTLRSAASFGSFHLLRLLYDEYIFYLIEHKVAKATGVVPIEVIGNGKEETEEPSSLDDEQQFDALDTNPTSNSERGNNVSNMVSVAGSSNGSTASQQQSNGFNQTPVKVESKRVKNFLTR